MNDEKSNCMVLKQKQKHHETNNRWKGEGEELQMERFRNSRERVTRVPGSCPLPEFQPRLCWVVCLRCSWVPPGMQEKGHCHSWVSSCLLLVRLLHHASSSPGGQEFPRPPAHWEGGLVPSAFIFLVYLFIQLLGLKVLQTVCSATHDFIWGFHKPLEEEMEE